MYPESPLAWLDVETTGLDPKIHGIHELTFLIQPQDKVELIKTNNVNPGPDTLFCKTALAISGVTLKQIKKYPSRKAVKAELVGWFSMLKKKYGLFNLAGFNTGFDRRFLEAFLGDDIYRFFEPGYYDVRTLALKARDENLIDLPKANLSAVAQALGINFNKNNLHGSEYDIKLTVQVYNELKKKFEGAKICPA